MSHRKYNYNKSNKEKSDANQSLSTSNIPDGRKNKDLDFGGEKQKALDAYYIGQNEDKNQSKLIQYHFMLK